MSKSFSRGLEGRSNVHRQDFKQHPLWAAIDRALECLDRVRDTQPSPDEVPALLRIEFLLRHVASFKSMAATSCALFNESLMAPVHGTVAQIVSQLEQRQASVSYRVYTDNALSNAESLLTQVGLWPRPYAKGAQVQQLNTLYEDLLRAQAEQINNLEARYDEAKSRIDGLVSELERKKDEVSNEIETYRADAVAISGSVENEKSRIDDVVQKGLERVSELQTKNSDAFSAWKIEKEGEWQAYAKAQKESFDKAAARAAASLKKLLDDEKEFANLSAAAGGAKLASEFETEAKSSHILGLWLYAVGIVVLVAGAIPLILWLWHTPVATDESGTWQHFLIRVSLGIIGASAATVLIRLGSRFLSGATASRRMALELQTFGPFLANVQDKETVDGARLELVDRAFGKSYVNVQAEAKDDVVPVSAFAHILDLVKAIK